MGSSSKLDTFKHRSSSWGRPFFRKKSPAKEERFSKALTKCAAAAAREFKDVKKEAERLDNIRQRIRIMVRDARNVTFPDNLSAEIYAEQSKARDGTKKAIVAFAQKFKKQLDTLSEEIAAKYKELKDFKIVLFGCTKAGKSTLREALTMGNGSTIGKGGQSTTKKVTKYTWDGLCLYDTPGVDSSKDLDGSETKAALTEMRNADLAIFVMMPAKISGSAELRYLKQVIACGHDVLVLLNVKESLDPYVDFEAMRNEELISDEGQKENIETIRAGIGDENLSVQVIHAQAGYLACAPDSSDVARKFLARNDVTRKKLLAISRFDEMKARIESLVLKDGIRLRVKGVRLKFIDSLEAFCEKHHADFTDLKMACEKAANECQQMRKRIKSVFEDYVSNATKDLMFEAGQSIDIDSFVERCFNEKWDKDKRRKEWESYLKGKLKEVAEHSLRKQTSKIKKYVDELKLRLSDIVASVEKLNFDANGVNWKSMFEKGAGFFGVVCVLAPLFAKIGAANFWNPVGWGSLAASVALGILACFFKSKNKKKSELRTRLKESIRENIGVPNKARSLAAICIKALREQVNVIDVILNDTIATQERMVAWCEDSESILDEIRVIANENRRKLEQHLKEISNE